MWPAVLCHAMPGFPPSDALAVKKCLGVNAAPLVQRDPPQLQGPVTVNPALSSRNMPIRSRYPHFAAHHDRPISVSSLDRRRGREKLSRKERRSSYKEGGCMTSDIALSARPRASGRLVDWHILQAFPVARRLSCQFCSWRGPIGGSSADLPRKCSWQSPRDDPAASNQPRATQSGRIRHVLRQGGNSPGRSQRIIHLQHLGHS